jgi:predicted NBD/HSP70 family sugar kinase
LTNKWKYAILESTDGNKVMKNLQKIFRNEAITMVKVLELIRRKGPISQAELARQMNLTRASVNIYAKKLLKEGVVHQAGHAEVGVGRPQTLLDLDRRNNGVIGICLDYPQLNGGLADFSEKIVETQSCDISEVKTLDELESYLVDLVQRLIAVAQAKKITLHSVCFGTSGVIDGTSGRILNHVNFPLANGLDPQKLISSILKVPVYVVPLGISAYWGALQAEDENRRIFHVIWDLGIGVILGNGYDIKLSEYQRDKEGIGRGLRDMGHVIWKPEGHLCHCGQKGCLEAYFGGWAMMRDIGESDWKRFLKRVADQDGDVKGIVTRCAQQLGAELSWIFAVHRPCKIRFSGELPDAGPWIFNAFNEGLERRLGKEIAASLEPENVRDYTALQVRGSCRIANHLRFNLPLLPIVRVTEDDEIINSVVSV